LVLLQGLPARRAHRNPYKVHECTASPLAKEALERSADLFAIEARINSRAPAQR
jgi:hypothetical protein